MHKKALLITYPEENAKREAEALADAAGYSITDTITQRHLTRSKYGIGSGKAEEIKEMIKEEKPDLIIFDEVIGPTQAYNLATLLQVEIIDRERLILEIFEKRARSAESSIQVKLAQLRYEMTRAREKVRLAKKGEQPGFYGLGKYEVDSYYRDIKRRIASLKRQLEKVSKRRELYRYQRQKQGLYTISLAGYTSAGKTTLFNALVNERHETGIGMFTTLATFTRSLMLKDGKVLISDTVGFISKLPAYMIEAFKSTLNELTFSDLVLLIIDISEPVAEIARKYNSCLDILNELQVQQSKVLYVLNKIDLIGYDDAIKKALKIGLEREKCVPISAKNMFNLDLLKERMNDVVFKERMQTTDPDLFVIEDESSYS